MAEKANELRRREEGVVHDRVQTTPVAAAVVHTATQGYDAEDPDVIRARIAQTRVHMSETVDTIQARLSPGHLKEQAQEAIREATVGKVKEMAHTAEHTVKSWRSNVVNTIRQNPIPAALVAIGLGWLFMAESHPEEEYSRYSSAYRTGTPYPYGTPQSYAYGTQPGRSETPRSQVGEVVSHIRETAGEVGSNIRDTASEVKSNIQETASEVKSNIQETASQVAGQAKEQVGHLAEQTQQRVERMSNQAQYQMHQAKRSFDHMMVENPLAVGAVALAAGAAVGLLIPSSPQENEWMGETRDRLVEKAQVAAQETMERVRHTMEEMQVDDSEKTVATKPASTPSPPPRPIGNPTQQDKMPPPSR